MKKVTPILLFLLLVYTGCRMAGDKAAAEDMAKNLFELVRLKDFDAAMAPYSPSFFEKTPKDRWRRDLENLNRKLGDLQSYKLLNWSASTYVGSLGNGNYVQLHYEVVYSRYPARETLAFFRPAAGGDLKIVGHAVNSPGLLAN